MTKTCLLVLSLAIAGFACGDDKKPAEPEKAKAAPAAEPAPPPAKEPAPATVDVHITDDNEHNGASVKVKANLEVK